MTTKLWLRWIQEVHLPDENYCDGCPLLSCTSYFLNDDVICECFMTKTQMNLDTTTINGTLDIVNKVIRPCDCPLMHPNELGDES